MTLPQLEIGSDGLAGRPDLATPSCRFGRRLTSTVFRRSCGVPKNESVLRLISEREIRSTLIQHLERQHQNNPASLVVEELVLAVGAGRVDLAVASDKLHGFEIKSDFDRLDRLATQAPLYSASFDAVTLVCGPRLAAAAAAWVPEWWELMVVERTPCGLTLRTSRHGGPNPSLDPMAVAGLLWKTEALALLPPQRAHRLRHRPRSMAWSALIELMGHSELTRAVAQTLIRRQGWRVSRSPDRQ